MVDFPASHVIPLSMDFSASNLKGGIGSILSYNWQEKYRLYTRYSPCLRLGVI